MHKRNLSDCVNLNTSLTKISDRRLKILFFPTQLYNNYSMTSNIIIIIFDSSIIGIYRYTVVTCLNYRLL